MEILWWFVVWFLIWIIFNIRFNWKIAKTKKEKYLVTSFFFSLSSLAVYFIFNGYLSKSRDFLLFAFIISLALGIFFSNYYPYYKHIKNGKYFLISLAFDILLQQTMVVVGVKILSQYLGSNYKDFYFGFMFSIAHLPVLLCKWAKLRYLYIILTFFGGMVFSYLINKYSSLGVATAFLIHYCLYIPIFYYLKDERKI